MWIKRTTVKTKAGTKTYLQLVRSVWEDGKPKQRIIANLGREDKVRAEVVDSLLKTLKQYGTYDSLDPDEIKLLDTKNYGNVYVLHRIAQISGLSRFLHDISIAHDKRTSSVSSILALVYFLELVEHRSDANFDKWLGGCHMPWSDNFSLNDVLTGLELIYNRRLICEGISMLYSEKNGNEKGVDFRYILSSKVYLLSKIPRMLHIVMTTQSDFNPVEVSVISNTNPKEQLCSRDDGVYIFDEDDTPQRLLEHIIENNCDFIFKLYNYGTLERFGIQDRYIREMIDEGGVFEECEDIGYREIVDGDLRYAVLRPYPGSVSRLSGGFKEPRELLIIKSAISTYSAVKAYTRIGNLQNSFYNLHMPVDLIEHLEGSIQSILDKFIILKFIGTFLEFYLEKILQNASLDITVQQALLEMGNMRITEISTGNASKYYHTALNDTQKSILQALGLSPPPKITI